MLGCQLWSAVCFFLCCARFKPTNTALLLEENYRVPSTRVKSGGKVSEERSLFPRELPNLDSGLASGSRVPTYLPFPAQGFATVQDPMGAGGRWMDPSSLDKTCISQLMLMLLPAVLKAHAREKESLQGKTGLLLSPTFVSPARSCRAAPHSKITLPRQQALLGLLL